MAAIHGNNMDFAIVRHNRQDNHDSCPAFFLSMKIFINQESFFIISVLHWRGILYLQIYPVNPMAFILCINTALVTLCSCLLNLNKCIQSSNPFFWVGHWHVMWKWWACSCCDKGGAFFQVACLQNAFQMCCVQIETAKHLPTANLVH